MAPGPAAWPWSTKDPLLRIAVTREAVTQGKAMEQTPDLMAGAQRGRSHPSHPSHLQAQAYLRPPLLPEVHVVVAAAAASAVDGPRVCHSAPLATR